MTDKFSATVTIDASPEEVWASLTDTGLMAEWMGTPEMKLKVQTGWVVNTPILISGFLYSDFENKGVILRYDKYNKLSYSHLSSVSGLVDRVENYSILEFSLTPFENKTILVLGITNFPTEIIRKHLEFYWRTAIVMIKRSAERGIPGNKTTFPENYK